MHNIKLLVFTLLYSILSLKSYSQSTIYLSPDGSDNNDGSIEYPYKTFDKVFETIREFNAEIDGNITVYLRGGVYYLDKTIKIDKSLSGNNEYGIEFKAYGEEKPVLSGGQKVTSWEHYDDKIYRAFVGDNSFRQLYINNVKAVRSREPNLCNNSTLNWNINNREVLINSQDIVGIQNVDTSQPIELFVQKVFACQILRLSAFDYQNSIRPLDEMSVVNIVDSDQAVFTERKHQVFNGQAYHLENSYQFLDTPGEWYLDKNKGYLYVYMDSISIEEIVIPKLENIVNIQGSPGDFVENIKFEGITFEHSNWLLPDTLGLYAGQALYIYDQKQPKNGIISVEYAKNVVLERNIFKNGGGAGVSFYEGVQNSRITANVVKDIAGNGIEVDRRWERNAQSNSDFCSHIKIDNNLISNIGTDYFSGVGIFVGYADSVLIEHNLLYKLPYTGISVGWGWTLNETELKNNEIRYNIVDSPLSLLSDGGAIYTLSNQPGTSIHHNLLKNIRQSSLAKEYFVTGIYLDQGSNNIKVYENIFRETDKRYHINSKGNNSIIVEHKEGKKTVSFAGIQPNYIEIMSEIPETIPCYDSYFDSSQKKSEVLDLLVYPNPLTGNVKVYDYNLLLSNYVNCEIINMEGKTIYKSEFAKQKYKPLHLDLSNLANGMYILKVHFHGFVGTSILLKQ